MHRQLIKEQLQTCSILFHQNHLTLNFWAKGVDSISESRMSESQPIYELFCVHQIIRVGDSALYFSDNLGAREFISDMFRFQWRIFLHLSTCRGRPWIGWI